MFSRPFASAPLLVSALVGLAACSATNTPVVVPRKLVAPAPAAARAPLVLPTQVHLPMPAALEASMGGSQAASLIGPDNIILNGGGNIVAQGGGNIVAQGGGNYHVLAAGAVSACAAPTITGQAYFGPIMNLVMAPYGDAVLIINGVLAQAKGLRLDTPAVVNDPRGSGKLTLIVSQTATGGLLRVAEGSTYTDASEIMGLAFTSPTQGVAVYRSLTLHPDLGHLAIATHFDLTAGKVSADGLADPTALPNPTSTLIYRAHWEFAVPLHPTAGEAAFTMRLAGNNHDTVDACNSADVAVSANFLPDGSGAVRMGRVLPGGTALSYTRNDGNGYDPTASASDDFFLGTDGNPLLAGSTASAGLVAAAPPASTFLTSYPPDPGVGKPFADAAFAFPTSAN